MCIAADDWTAVRDFAKLSASMVEVDSDGRSTVMGGWIVVACAAGSLLALGSPAADAAGRGSGTPGGFTGTPPGFASPGGHGGFEGVTPSGATSPTNLPNGWDQGKADWKANLQRNPPVLPTCPPGLRC